ncbi:MAG: cytochrome P450 [Roseibium sp.]|uniref:cytochrome P450 n=1 Tax=Roseibium sp. TaxID=1936156 RepID=UPI001B0CA3C8|nr:cytochrome P450 [Roseibium sp.]MBO6895172.1 cytochrome P450 [Roseibium sp.]MBO6930546.1 cytochrome P450 [Roseibium sp.]
MSVAETFYVPPRPSRLPPVMALLRTVWNGEGDLLSLLPGAAFAMDAGALGYSRRSIKLFNDPELVRQILHDADGIFPKSDLMVGALEALIGDSIFVSDGAKWRRQRAMIDPAFSKMRLTHAFKAMQQAVDAYVERLHSSAERGEILSLDRIMSELTADIICRTVFSTSLDTQISRDVFDDFEVFERGVAQVKIWRLIMDPAWTKVPQSEDVLAACKRIRHHLGGLIDTHTGADADRFDDIASAVISARDAETGEPFTRDELIDQLGVFFLAGHETTASALTWAFYMLAMCPEILARLRSEVDAVAEGEELTYEATRSLTYTRAIFRETLRLYPPITFMPRVALKATRIGTYKVRKGALLMISPWTLHRHTRYWTDPDCFDPDRFMPDREKEVLPGTYIPFGSGPHTCVGAGFAAIESALILGRLTRAFDFSPVETGGVRPAARLTTRPSQEIQVRVRSRSHGH